MRTFLFVGLMASMFGLNASAQDVGGYQCTLSVLIGGGYGGPDTIVGSISGETQGEPRDLHLEVLGMVGAVTISPEDGVYVLVVGNHDTPSTFHFDVSPSWPASLRGEAPVLIGEAAGIARMACQEKAGA